MRAPRWSKLLRMWMLALVCGAVAAAAVPTAAQSLPPERVAQLAARLGWDAAALENVESEAVTLIDGRRIERFKGFNPSLGEAVGGAFENGEPVDLREAQKAARESWRAVHGALTPALVARLAEAAPGDRLPFVAWLEVDLAGVPEHAAEATARHEGGTALGLPAADRRPETTQPKLEETEKSADAPRLFQRPDELVAQRERQDAIDRADRAHLAAVSGAVAVAREEFLARAALAGVEIEYASAETPLAVGHGTREQIEKLAFLPGLDALYDGSGQGGPSLQYARPTQNVTPINSVGYDGTGVNVSVTEGERGFAANPYLSWAGFYDGGQPYANHPTAVGGMIRSTHATQRGLAADVSLYSANGSYSTYATMSAAMDWGSTNARVLSNSWYWDSANSPDPWAADRQQDWFVRQHFDSVLVAAGNFGNGCGGNFSTYVVSPAKGNNILAIGNDDDVDTVAWSGDSMNVCSSFGNPHNSTGGTIAKPEMSGVGTNITSTIPSTDPNAAVGPVGSGTSYSTPMVAATAADIMEADAGLQSNPEAVKAVLMATALHNIEGASRYSDVDGAGSLVGAAAAASAERGNWQDEFINSSTTFPIVKTQFAYAGEKVRFVLAWSSNPNAAYSTDPLPADLDLAAYRADGTTLLASSASGTNAFEIVEFTAPASETYQFRITLFSSDWTSGGTWMGSGWWRGEYRISPDTGYTDADAPPTGTHLAVYPADWTPTNYWRAFGLRPRGTSDYDLELANHSLFEDPGLRTVLRTSSYASQTPDFIVVDGNQWSASAPEHYRAKRFSGADGYDISFSNLGLGAGSSSSNVTLGPVTMSGAQVVKVFDVWVPAFSHRRVRVVPASGSANLGLRFFKSDPGVSTTWAQARSGALVARNRSSSGTATERGGVANSTAASDWLGLVVEKFDTGTVTFNVVVLPPSLFSDDFESGDTLEWSSVVP